MLNFLTLKNRYSVIALIFIALDVLQNRKLFWLDVFTGFQFQTSSLNQLQVLHGVKDTALVGVWKEVSLQALNLIPMVLLKFTLLIPSFKKIAFKTLS